MENFKKTALCVFVSISLVACGGSDDDSDKVSATPASLTTTTDIAKAAAGIQAAKTAFDVVFSNHQKTIEEVITDKAESPDYLDAEYLTDIGEFYLDVSDVKYLAKAFKKFKEDDLRRRFLSDAFKRALSSNGDDKIYRGENFGDEDYFKRLWSGVNALSNYFIEAHKLKKGMLFWYV